MVYTVQLPSDIQGNAYCICRFRGARRIIIPAELTEISAGMFIDNGGLRHISVVPENPNYASQDGILYNKDKTVIIAVPGGISGKVSIAEETVVIGYRAFYHCVGLESITIPSGVRTIESEAFSGCANLKTVIMRDGLEAIGYSAFWECVSLQNIVLPNTLKEIWDSAFWGCSSLYNIDIPVSVSYIGQAAFGNPIGWNWRTGLHDNPEYRKNGMFIIDGWLIDVHEDLVYLSDIEDIRGIIAGAYDNCNLLKTAVWGSAELPSNVETVYITHINQMTDPLQNTVTLKNVVICDSVSASDLRYCRDLFSYTTHICVDCGDSYVDALGLLGDVNGDGKINTTDAKLVMQYELGLIPEFKPAMAT